MSETEPLAVTNIDENGVATVRLQHGKVNALSAATLAAVADEFTKLRTADIGCAVLTGGPVAGPLPAPLPLVAQGQSPTLTAGLVSRGLATRKPRAYVPRSTRLDSAVHFRPTFGVVELPPTL